MKNKVILIFVIVISLILLKQVNYGAQLGEINYYQLSVSPSSSGKLNMIYHFEITFLQDDVDTLQLKVPNEFFAVKSKSDLIKSIIPEKGYAVVTLNKKYDTGEKVNLTFNLLQSNMYTIVESKNLCKFKFRLGNVKDYKIEKMKLQWSKKSVLFCQSGIENDKYYVVERNYSIIRNFNVLVEYNADIFKLEPGGEKAFTLYDFVNGYFLVGLGIFIIVAEIIAYNRKGCKH